MAKSIDTYGDVRLTHPDLPKSTFRARLVTLGPRELALFTLDAANKSINAERLYLTEDFRLSGRSIIATPTNSGATFEFRKAGCSCQTPRELRGPQSRFLSLLPEVPAEEPA